MRVTGKLEGEDKAAFDRLRVQDRPDLLDQARDIEVGRLELDGPGLDPGDVKHIVDDRQVAVGRRRGWHPDDAPRPAAGRRRREGRPCPGSRSSGVLISWLMVARNSDLARLGRSSWPRPVPRLSTRSAAFLPSVTSCHEVPPLPSSDRSAAVDMEPSPVVQLHFKAVGASAARRDALRRNQKLRDRRGAVVLATRHARADKVLVSGFPGRRHRRAGAAAPGSAHCRGPADRPASNRSEAVRHACQAPHRGAAVPRRRNAPAAGDPRAPWPPRSVTSVVASRKPWRGRSCSASTAAGVAAASCPRPA